MNDANLVFVYNANSGLFSTVTDFAHKIFSPSTYQCSLCALTFGNFSMKHEWKLFIKSLPLKATFIHKDEFLNRYNTNAVLPAAFILTNGAMTEIITKQEIENARSLEDLKKLVIQKLEEHAQHHHSNMQ